MEPITEPAWKKFNYCAIESTGREQGSRVIQFWKSVGADTGRLTGYVVGYSRWRYYALIDGKIKRLSLEQLKTCGVTLIDLPEPKKLFWEPRKKYEGCVIEALDRGHGKKIIEFWKSLGYKTCMSGNCHAADDDDNRYYGAHKGNISNFTLQQVEELGLKVITLPDPPKILPALQTMRKWENAGMLGELDHPTTEERKEIENNNKNQNNGKSISVPKVTPTITRGERILGSPVSGKRGRATIGVGHLSLQKVSGSC